MHSPYAEDIDQITGLARTTGGPILELMSGTGRILLPLARAGYEVWGLEVNEAMMDRATAAFSQEPPDVVARIHLVRADVRSFSLGKEFPLVVLTYGSFQHLLEEADQTACLMNVADHLASHGHFFLSLSNFSPIPPGRLSRLATIMRIPESGVFGRIRAHAGRVPPVFGVLRLFLGVLTLWLLSHALGYVGRVTSANLGPTEDLLFVEIETTDQGTRTSRRDGLYAVIGEQGIRVDRVGKTAYAILTKADVEALLDRCGLDVVQFAGGYDGRPFKADSSALVYICEKRQSHIA